MGRKKKKTKKHIKSPGGRKPAKRAVSPNRSSPDVSRSEFQKAVQYHQAEQFEQAEEIYRKILAGHPNHSDALHLLGVLSHQTGREDAAAELISEAIRINPEHPSYHSNLGIVFQERGEQDKAIACYQKALEIKPDFPDAYNNMGFALQDQKKTDEAIECYQKALQLKPDYTEACNNLGTALKDQGKTEEAISFYQRALASDGKYVEAYHNMGTALKDQGRFDEAVSCYQKALEIRPNYAEVWNSMGTAFRERGRFDEAVSCYKKALEIRPEFSDVYNNLGTLLKEKGRFSEAIPCYQKALEITPDSFAAYLNMGNTFQDMGKPNEAISCYEKALEIRPDYAVAYDNMRNAYMYQGKVEEAVLCCEKSLEIRPDPGIEVRKILMIPVIYESKEQILSCRDKIISELESLKNRGIRLDDPNRQVGTSNFYLAYHGLNDREIQQKIASFYMDVCPDLACNLTVGSRQSSAAANNGQRIRIGVVSMHLFNMSQQTIGKLTRGIIRNLSREKFHIILFRFPGGETGLIRSIHEGADEVVDLPSELKPAREMIASHSPDILFYPDIGMDSLTYFLGFSRLAPVQCVTWGHPVTTGIPNMDYFLSSEDLEPPGSEDHYSEKLVRMSRLSVYYYRPEIPDEPPSREKFGLPEGYNLYACPHAPFKFHPDFDLALASILRSDPRGLLVLIEGATFNHWASLLMNRFRNTFPDVVDRVRFMPNMPTKDFMSLMMTADVLLEPPYFGGGNTTYEALACGVPFVTWPGPFMRGRVTLALYRQMGVTDCVADDPQSYIDIAVRLASDNAWRDAVRKKIRTHADVIFEDMEAVRELEQFFENAASRIDK
ncbi:tetratricopeptide repeat protein [Desulfococcaceae bacterium HSG8]|nr:tetratricopeptide repeat protein [Desulfococcaceae bacterium HSG8]